MISRGEAAFRLHFLICTGEAVIGGKLIGGIVYARSRFSASMLGFFRKRLLDDVNLLHVGLARIVFSVLWDRAPIQKRLCFKFKFVSTRESTSACFHP